MSSLKKCPFCAEDIAVEAIKCRFCGEFLNKEHDETKTQAKHDEITVKEVKKLEEEALINCRFCDELISPLAIKCKHCGEFLNKRNQENISPGNEKAEYKDETLGLIALVLPAIAIIITSAWLGGMQVTVFNIDVPGRILTSVSWICIGITSVLIAIEASKLECESPLKWFLLVNLAWIFAFPLYFRRRIEHKLKNYFGVSFIIAVLFTASIVFWYFQIEKTQVEINNKMDNLEEYFKF